MLIKEYRIPLPLSVEEYRIAQLYMIQKKSRLDSTGEGSGVEIIKNHPYENGPGGCGQYTKKVYHIGNHIPGWLKAIVPKSALQVIEEAWNAYPYTKMRTTCPFVERFFVDIETKYLPDDGSTENVFNLSPTEISNQTTDLIDPVKDPIPTSSYSKEEDPLLYVSKKTGRGPLTVDWLQTPPDTVMCAYKRISVEFKYWGMQGKIEQFIHDGLRKPMLMGHRQAWVWQDEWYGLTIDDIRELERETQAMLAKKMGNPTSSELSVSSELSNGYEEEESEGRDTLTTLADIRKNTSVIELLSQESMDTDEIRCIKTVMEDKVPRWRIGSISKSDSDEEFFDANDEFGSGLSDDEDQEKFLQVRKERLERSSHSGGSIDSLDSLENEEQRTPQKHAVGKVMSLGGSTTSVNQLRVLVLVVHGGNPLELSQGDMVSKENDCERLVREFKNVMENHYKAGLGRVVFRLVECPQVFQDALSALKDITPEMADEYGKDNAATSPQSFNFPLSSLPILAACSSTFAEMVDRMIVKSNEVYREFLSSEAGAGFNGEVCVVGDCIGALLAYDAMCRTLTQTSFDTDSCSMSVPPSPMTQRMASPRRDQYSPASGSCGNLSGGTSTGSLASSGGGGGSQHAGGNLNRRLSGSLNVIASTGANEGGSPRGTGTTAYNRYLSGSYGSMTSGALDGSGYHQKFFDTSFENFDDTKKAFSDDFKNQTLRDTFIESKFEFEISKFFAFGSPIGLVLLYKKFSQFSQGFPVKPACGQFYNLFHPCDPMSSRIEPLILPQFSNIPPIDVPRYQKFPLGDGLCNDVTTWLTKLRTTTPRVKKTVERQSSNISTTSIVSWDTFGGAVMEDLQHGVHNWWGNERLDYALYSPKNLHQLPHSVLCPLFHISYWESKDVVAFMLRQILELSATDMVDAPTNYRRERRQSSFHIPNPREKWLKKRTMYKIRNLAPNHRANDAIALEGSSQVITARFAYGPLDVAALSGEKVDIYIMNYPPTGEWNFVDSCITGSGGKMSFTIPDERKLEVGIYPVKMVVRGDHTTVDTSLAVLPPKTEAVVFSIDGSFSASVSLRGRHPKVQPGAVDVVRHWQEKGYVIIYVTSRPDFQKYQVMLWMAEHNFPFGLVSFCGSLSTVDIQRHKSEYLRTLTNNMKVVIHAAYGSSKDIAVYSGVGLAPNAIFVIGKHSRKGDKKYEKQATYLRNGYSTHLSSLANDPISRPPAGNSRLTLRRGCFGLPRKQKPLTKRTVKGHAK